MFRPPDCRRAITHLQFSQDILHVIARRIDADAQGLRDFPIAIVLRDEFQNFNFTRHQFCMDEELCVWRGQSNHFNLKLQASISSERFLPA